MDLKLVKESGLNINLFSINGPIYSDSAVSGVYLQKAGNSGAVINHYPEVQGITEIIQIVPCSVYDGLNSAGILNIGDSYVVKKNDLGIYPSRESNAFFSYGEWLSIQLLDAKSKHLTSKEIGSNSSVMHTFDIANGVLDIAVSDSLTILKKYISNPDLIIGLPSIKGLAEDDFYAPFFSNGYDRIIPNQGRYLVLKRDI